MSRMVEFSNARSKTIRLPSGVMSKVRIAAGLLVLLGAILGCLVHPAFVGLSAFVGAGLVFAGVTDTCGMGMLLARMPWNQVKEDASCCGVP